MSRKIRYSGYSFASLLTPSQIFGANYYDHWRAEDLVLSNGDPVDNWVSVGLSGHNFHAPSGFEPTFVSNFLNSYPAINLDGVSDYMEINNGLISDFNFLNQTQGAIFIIFNKKTGSAELISNVDTAENPRKGIRTAVNFSGSETRILTYRRGANTPVVLTQTGTIVLTNDTVNLLEFKHNLQAPLSIDWGKVIINNNQVYTNTSSNDSIVIENPNGFLNLGRAVNNFNFSAMDVLEILIVDAEPTAQQEIDIVNYFSNKYDGTFPI